MNLRFSSVCSINARTQMHEPTVDVGDGHQYRTMVSGSTNRTTCSPCHGPTILPNFSNHSPLQAPAPWQVLLQAASPHLQASFSAKMSGHRSFGASVMVSSGGPDSGLHFCTRLTTSSATALWISAPLASTHFAVWMSNLILVAPGNPEPLPPPSPSPPPSRRGSL